jgi:hypothetical protein
MLIGTSGFEGVVSVDKADVERAAKKVGAEVVLYSSKYLGSEQRVVPYTTYEPGTSTTTYSTANLYGTYGTGSIYGVSQSYTSGTFSTQFVPVTASRYAHFASFWVKAKPPIIGVYSQPLSDDLRQRLQRNGGARVVVVVNESPAYRANVLPGDVILRWNDTDVGSPQDLIEKCKAQAGQTVQLTVWRDGSEKIVPVHLNRLAE